ncbi:MAG: carbohydrate kinase family protein [Hyphomicrobium sp.]
MAERTILKVTTIGGALIDTIAVISDDAIERMSMNNAEQSCLLLEVGRKTEAEIISTHSGGGAINSAVCFARLGMDVAAVCKVGRDARADAIRGTLAAEGVSSDYLVVTDRAVTGASVLISAHERDAAIFTYRGANSLFVEGDVPIAALARDLVYITGLSDQSADLFPSLVRAAAALGAFVAVNPGIRQLTARGDAFAASLADIALLSMNRTEAATLVPRLMAGRPRRRRTEPTTALPAAAELMRRGLMTSGFEMAFDHYLTALLSHEPAGPRVVLVTDGKRGAYAATADDIVFCPSLAVNVVGTSGAGDAFSSTFAAFYAGGASLGEALRMATVNAASVVQFADTQTGLLRHDALQARFADAAANLVLAQWTMA